MVCVVYLQEKLHVIVNLAFFTGTSQSSTHYRYPVLHEVHWGADFQSVVTRKLINETHGNI